MNADKSSGVLARLNVTEPVHAVLTTTSNPLQQAQSWAHITTRLDALPRQTPRTRRALALMACSTVLLMLGFGLDAWLFSSAPKPTVAVTPTADAVIVPGPIDTKPIFADLRLKGGAEFKRLQVEEPGSAAREHTSVTFEDGSLIEALAAHTLVEALAMTERDVTLRLASGSIKVSVTKGGARKWLIEAGELSVEVVGTQFVVVRTADKARVEVNEGVVLVRSEGLPDGVKRLVAGESQEVETRRPLPNETVDEELSTLAHTPTFDTLLQKADEARRAGDLETARIRLQHLLNTFPHDAQSGVVAFQLAVVVQQLGASPARVVAAFETALSTARGQSLRQDCYWRLVLALEHAGRYEDAKQRAEQSLRAYPNGRYTAELRQRTTATPPTPNP